MVAKEILNCPIRMQMHVGNNLDIGGRHTRRHAPTIISVYLYSLEPFYV